MEKPQKIGTSAKTSRILRSTGILLDEKIKIWINDGKIPYRRQPFSLKVLSHDPGPVRPKNLGLYQTDFQTQSPRVHPKTMFYLGTVESCLACLRTLRTCFEVQECIGSKKGSIYTTLRPNVTVEFPRFKLLRI